MIDPVFGPFLLGKLLSFTGIWVYSVVAAIVAFELTGSAFVVGVVTAAQFAPQLLLAALSGRLADRGNPAIQVVLGRLLVGGGSGGLAAWIWLTGGVDELGSATPVAVASLVVGLGLVVGGPAMQAMVPSMIRPGEMTAAMALETIPMTVARAGGPVLGAAVAGQFGVVAAFALAGFFNLVFALIVLALRLSRAPARDADADTSMKAALRHVRKDASLGVLLLGIAAVGVGVDPSLTLAPALAHDLGGGAQLVGWLTSSFGIGAGIGFALFSPLHHFAGLQRLSGGGLLLIALGLGAAAVSWTAPVALLAFGLSGVGMTLAFASITSQIQDRSPDALRGRIMALWFLGFLGARPFSAGLSGLLADEVSVDVAFLSIALVVGVVAYLCRPSRLSTSCVALERAEPLDQQPGLP